MTCAIAQTERLALELVNLRIVVAHQADDIESIRADLQGLQVLLQGCECFSTGEKMEVEP
jgi:hypothetical protein